MKTKREFEYTEFVAPTKIRWAERSKNVVTATEGGYDLAPEGDRDAGHALQRARGPRRRQADRPARPAPARKGADDFGQSIKAAVEAS